MQRQHNDLAMNNILILPEEKWEQNCNLLERIGNRISTYIL